MHKLLLTFIIISSFSCTAQKVTKEWLGYVDEQKVSSSFDWFKQGYDNYSPDSGTVVYLSKVLPSYTLLVFGGVWCSDTKRLLPKFYKTIDKAGISHNKVKLYLLNEKKRSPNKLEKSYDITRIPVFILFKDGKEAGRITERVETSIEKDLAELVR